VTDLLDAAASAWATWMAAIAPRVVVLGAAAIVADRLLWRRGFARLRLALWTLCALACVVPPDLVAPTAILAAPAPSDLPSPGPAPVRSHVPFLLFGLWAVVAATLLIRLAIRRGRLGRLVRPADPASAASLRGDLGWACARAGLTHVPRIGYVRGLPSPAVAGLLLPRLLLPGAGSPGHEAGRLVLLHEMMHLKRRDLWAQALLDALAALYWFHPVVLLARRRARALREACCDLDVAQALGDEAPAYRACLARLAGARWLDPLPEGASGWLLPRPAMAERLLALDHRARRPARRDRALAWALLAALAALLLPRAGGLERPASLLQGELDAARAHLARTFAQRDRYGCFHRQHAWLQVLDAQERLAAGPGAQATSSPFPEE